MSGSAEMRSLTLRRNQTLNENRPQWINRGNVWDTSCIESIQLEPRRFGLVEEENASKSEPGRGHLSAFHFRPQFGFLLPHRQVWPSGRGLGRIHWLPDVVPRYRGAAELQISWPRPVNSWLEVGQNALRDRLLPDPSRLYNGDLRACLADWTRWVLQQAVLRPSFQSIWAWTDEALGKPCPVLRLYCDDHGRSGLRYCTWGGNRLARISCTGACQTPQLCCDCHHFGTHLGRVALSNFSFGGWLQWRHAGLVLLATVYVIVAGD